MTGEGEDGRRRPRRFSTVEEDIEAIRGALADAVEHRSLRAVAREMRMSPSGLRALIDGAHPYGKTREKAREWYTVHGTAGQDDLPPETVFRLLGAMFRGMPHQNRFDASVRVLNAFREGFRRAGVQPPRWIAAVRKLNEPREWATGAALTSDPSIE